MPDVWSVGHPITDTYLTVAFTNMAISRMFLPPPAFFSAYAHADSPSELQALTPAMILSGSSEDDVVPGVFVQKDVYRRAWRKTQYLANVFWTRWLTEYLPLLERRQKYQGSTVNFKPGDLVLVKDEQLKRSHWPKTVLRDVFPDKTGLVRRVKVKTANAIMIRDIRKLSLLEVSDYIDNNI